MCREINIGILSRDVFFYAEVENIEKHICKVKFHNRKIVCASAVLCLDCSEAETCEDIDIYIEGPYEGIEGCMTTDSYEKKNGKIRQKRWGK